MKRNSAVRFVILGLVVQAMVLTACQPAAQTTAEPTTPVEPTTAEVVEPTATVPAAVCDKQPNAPTVAAGELGSPDKPIVMTFVPSGETGKITKAGTEIADCLSKMTGLTFQIEVGTSYAASIEAMGANKAQIGFLNTFSILLAQEKYGIVPVLANVRKYNTNSVDPDAAMAGEMQPFYKGQFITKADSGIKQFSDLKGKSFCFVDPNSASGYIVPRIILKANGVDPDVDLVNVQNAGSHPNVAIAVYNGDCDAGVTYIDVMTDESANLKEKYPDIAEKVVPFAVSERIPNDGVQVTKELDPAIKDAVVEGLLFMAQDPGGKVFLKNLYSINGFQKIDENFYQDFADVLKAAGVDPASLIQ
jgi:phosphonate transport system substrate-binding protein